MPAQTAVPYSLTRLGLVMTPEPGNPLEAMGVLNPGSGRAPDGRLHLLPRIVAAGNVSRVGLAEVVVRDGVPVGGERRECPDNLEGEPIEVRRFGGACERAGDFQYVVRTCHGLFHKEKAGHDGPA